TDRTRHKVTAAMIAEHCAASVGAKLEESKFFEDFRAVRWSAARWQTTARPGLMPGQLRTPNAGAPSEPSPPSPRPPSHEPRDFLGFFCRQDLARSSQLYYDRYVSHGRKSPPNTPAETSKRNRRTGVDGTLALQS